MRADRYLVEQGHYPSRARAQAAIRAGCVRVDGRPLRKASAPIPDGAEVVAVPEHPWVSRGGLKLDHALSTFGLDVRGRDCLDVGASTGGFTQVLLARGAARVVAVDVGHGQLHEAVRADPRVVVMERMDARDLTRALVGEPEVVVCDASFIGLRQVLPVPLSLAAPGAVLVALVKPQFEVGREDVGRGGVVRDAQARERAVMEASAYLTESGWSVEGRCASPIAGGGAGGTGNRETLLMARKAR